MIIKRIWIYGLHDQYDYDVCFNDRITFLFGPNGSGKTTILNILATIVKGQLYDLDDYNFRRIVLEYETANEHRELIQIDTEFLDKNTRSLVVALNQEKYRIEDFDNLKDRLYRKAEGESLDEYFWDQYPFAKKIKNIFNYVYLPLNRFDKDAIASEREVYRYINRNRYYEQSRNSYKTYLNDSLRQIEELIRNKCIDISASENRINENFKREILSATISVSSEMPIKKIFTEIDNRKWQDVLDSKAAYIKILKEISVYDDNMQEKIESFFRDFEKKYQEYQAGLEERGSSILVDLAWQYAEFLKIQKIAELASENEKIKETIRKPRETFIEIINDFFESSGSDKRIRINRGGRVFFETKKQNLRLVDLSSGEKQIVIAFASLIFGLRKQSRGIFIIDEPEASLHLEWQSKFVPSILKINENVQMIFATHSPELIGKYRRNATKLTTK